MPRASAPSALRALPLLFKRRIGSFPLSWLACSPLLALAAFPTASRAGDAAALNGAAGLYHQARFDSARVRLEALLAEGPWRRRDSLMIFQYLGMASSRLGRDAEAVDRFGSLLAVDSLFRFPRNEDAAVLRNFRAAREARNSPVTVTPAVPPAAPAPEDPAPAAAVAPDPGPAIPAAPAPSLAAAARGAVPPPDSPLRDRGGDGRPAMNLAFGAVPFGGGWMARERMGYGLSLGLVQAGGLLLSIYASEMQSKAQDDREGLQPGERPAAVRWQWVQAVSLSTAVGAYFYSIFASGGD